MFRSWRSRGESRVRQLHWGKASQNIRDIVGTCGPWSDNDNDQIGLDELPALVCRTIVNMLNVMLCHITCDIVLETWTFYIYFFSMIIKNHLYILKNFEKRAQEKISSILFDYKIDFVCYNADYCHSLFHWSFRIVKIS